MRTRSGARIAARKAISKLSIASMIVESVTLAIVISPRPWAGRGGIVAS